MKHQATGGSGPTWRILVATASLLSVVALALSVPLYHRYEPPLAGVPFFYWGQFVLIALGAALTGVAALLLSNGGRDRAAAESRTADTGPRATSASEGSASAADGVRGRSEVPDG